MANPTAPLDSSGAKMGFGIYLDGANDAPAWVRIVDAAVVADETTKSGAMVVASKVLHDAADVAAEGPVKIGAVAATTTQAAVTAGDRVALAASLTGALHVVPTGGGALAALADDAAFTPGTNGVVMAGFEADETATDPVDEGDAGAARITLDRKQIMALYAHTAGGTTPYSALSTAAVLTAEIKGSAGQIYGLQVTNNGANEVFCRLYNQTGAPGSGDAVNIIWRGIVPGNAAGAGFAIPFPPMGIACATGIGIRISGAVADNDTTALAANEVLANVQYK